MFRGLWYGALGLAGLGAIALLLSLLLPIMLGNAFSAVGMVVAKLAIALFITSELGRLQFR